MSELRKFDNRVFLGQPFTNMEANQRTYNRLTKPKKQKERKKDKVSAIYAVICHKTNYVYIGQSKDVKNRLAQHQTELKHNKNHSGNGLMQEHYNLYSDSFTFEVLQTFTTNANRLQHETNAIAQYKADGYNLYNILHITTGLTIINIPQQHVHIYKAIMDKVDKGELSIDALLSLL